MRPTLLGFRAPDQRTAEFQSVTRVNKEGKHLNIMDHKTNPTGTNLPKAERFGHMPFYDRGTGQSVFIGPGCYKSGEAHNKLLKESCPTVMVSISSVFHKSNEILETPFSPRW